MVLLGRLLVQGLARRCKRTSRSLVAASAVSRFISSSSPSFGAHGDVATEVAASFPALASSLTAPFGAGWSSGSGSAGDEGNACAGGSLHWRAGIVGFVSSLALGILGMRNESVFGEADVEVEESEDSEQDNEYSLRSNTSFLLPDSYRRRIFFHYEQRIRARSPPEKVFEYFSSIRDSDAQAFMTPDDLMRALVPIFPPFESHVIREGYLAGERRPGELHCTPSEFFMLFDTNGDGLISFQEYMFLMTLLSIPESNFYATFKMFDRDGSGMIDKDEFKKVMEVMQSHTRQGVAHRDGRRSLGTRKSGSLEDCRLLQLFFGEDGKKRLSFADFENFLHGLHEEMLRLEFSHYDFNQRGTISACDFGFSMVAAADLSSINQYFNRAELLADDPRFNTIEITYQEFRQFAELRKQLRTLAVAMSSFNKSHGLLTKLDFQRAASQVCNVPVTDTVVDIVFHIFDLNSDGNLSMEEFLGALQRRENGVANPMESGLTKVFKCLFQCAQNCNSQMHLASM